MKKIRFLMLCLFAVATFGLVSCGDDKEENNTNKDMIVGNWQVDSMTLDGQAVNLGVFIIIMNEDGTGLLNNNGETENNQFTWNVNGNSLTIHHHHGDATYNIDKLSETEATLSGNTIPGMDGVQGSVVFNLVRIH